MDYEALLSLYNEISALTESGDEKGASELIGKRFAELPEDIQGELTTRLYFKALEEQVDEADAMAELQEKGLDAVDALALLKEKLEAQKA